MKRKCAYIELVSFIVVYVSVGIGDTKYDVEVTTHHRCPYKSINKN